MAFSAFIATERIPAGLNSRSTSTPRPPCKPGRSEHGGHRGVRADLRRWMADSILTFVFHAYGRWASAGRRIIARAGKDSRVGVRGSERVALSEQWPPHQRTCRRVHPPPTNGGKHEPVQDMPSLCSGGKVMITLMESNRPAREVTKNGPVYGLAPLRDHENVRTIISKSKSIQRRRMLIQLDSLHGGGLHSLQPEWKPELKNAIIFAQVVQRNQPVTASLACCWLNFARIGPDPVMASLLKEARK
ncbi:hypothetical protein B0H14DRAFT_2571739 [Mycena olivaceomarginata]|nr:hypothetical protein B0H14DRAFT_2571739 [Mycena olivaceomarginata]